MTSKKDLKIISIGGLLQCLSVIITAEFYIYELFHKQSKLIKKLPI
jgi:hypothetical protein